MGITHTHRVGPRYTVALRLEITLDRHMPTTSYLYREIHEQPQVLQTLLDYERQTIQALVADIRRQEIEYVVIAARGTSDNAGRYANYLLGAVNGLSVALATPSLYTIYQR